MRQILRAVLEAATFSVLLYAGTADAAPPKPLFASDDVINITLKGPITGISRSKTAKPVSGLLTVKGAVTETLPVTLSVRGVTRRRTDVCSFPPLRVVFPQKPSTASIFKGQKGLKLVTHCQSMESNQQYVLLEYAAYRLYDALTPDSFRVRLANIDYVDENDRPITSRFGFFIEDIDDVAKRNDQQRLRGLNKIANAQLDSQAAARFAIFEYMISNLDWAMTASAAGEDCCHNARLIGAAGTTTGLTPVPYDFDYSGLVDAPYAVPPDNIRAANVRTRIYRGFCQHNEQAQAFAADLLGRRTALFAVLDATPQLDERTRRKADSYLGDFFDQIGSPEKVSGLVKSCLQ